MKVIRLKNISNDYFQMAWNLYEDAFPPEERKSLNDQTYVLQNENYHFDIFLMDTNQFIGFILWWDFDSYIYIDHFATVKKQRNKGLGNLILNKIIDNNDKPILLEVELPTSSINERRIKFYKRIGFKINQHYYDIPISKSHQSRLQLLLMSYPNLISKNEIEQFIENFHPIIFKTKKNDTGN